MDYPAHQDTTHDEAARLKIGVTLRQYAAGPLMAAHRQVYAKALKPDFERRHGRPPDRWELQSLWESMPPYAMRSSLRRIAQENLFDTAGAVIERQLPELVDKARRAGRGRPKGSLRLDPAVTAPDYLTAVDIHCMPGGYHSEILPQDDVYAGALYDRTITSNRTMGANGSEGVGVALAEFVQRNFPGLRPKRILDMGCTVGHSTLGIADVFPEAEIHAIDVAAPCLRWAHLRAEGAGKAIHFSQQNAEKTSFPDGHFDLVLSVIMLHETSGKAIRNIFREARRLLRPGGVMAHCESRQYYAKEPFDAAWHRWGTKYNAEPFMTTMHELELQGLARECGFDRAFPQSPMLSTLNADLTIADDGPAPKGYVESLYVSGAVR